MMNIDLRPFLAIWVILAAVVLALIAWRKSVTRGEGESIHVLDTGTAVSAHQTLVAQKLEVIDRWGKVLTAIALIFGLALAALWAYQSYLSASRFGSGA